MALTLDRQTNFNLLINDAYNRVEDISLNKEEITFHLRSYLDVTQPFFREDIHTCVYDINGENPIKQAYEHLKTLPEFADAIDV
jgi:hypothetical protein